MRLSRSARKISPRGFTLVELLVAMTIASVVLLAVFGLVDQSSNSYRDTRRQTTVLADARAFLQFFESDLRSRQPGTPYLHLGIGGSVAIAFIRTRSYDERGPDDLGDLSTPIYYVALTHDGSGLAPRLFRRSIGPEETQEILESGPTPALPPIDPEIDEPVLHNVLHFSATPLRRDRETRQLVPLSEPGQRPEAVAVRITLLDDHAASRLTTAEDWENLGSGESTLARQARTFRRTFRTTP